MVGEHDGRSATVCVTNRPPYVRGHQRPDGVYHRFSNDVAVRDRAEPPVYRIKKGTFRVDEDGLSVNLATCAGCGRCSSTLVPSEYSHVVQFSLPQLREELSVETLRARFDPIDPPTIPQNPCHHGIIAADMMSLAHTFARYCKMTDNAWDVLKSEERLLRSKREAQGAFMVVRIGNACAPDHGTRDE